MPSPIQILPAARSNNLAPSRHNEPPRADDAFQHHLDAARQKPDPRTETQSPKPADKPRNATPAKKSAQSAADDQPVDAAQPTDTPTPGDAAPRPTDGDTDTAPADEDPAAPATDEHEDQSEPDPISDPTLAQALASLAPQPTPIVAPDAEPSPDDAAALADESPAVAVPTTTPKATPELNQFPPDALPRSEFEAGTDTDADTNGDDPLAEQSASTDLADLLDLEAAADPAAAAAAAKPAKPEKPLVSALGSPAPGAPADAQSESTTDQLSESEPNPLNPESTPNPDLVPADAHRSAESHTRDAAGESPDPAAPLNPDLPKPSTAAPAKSAQPAAQAPELAFADANHDTIVSSVRTQLAPHGNGAMQIRLDPPELGALKVMVEMRDGVMTATFQTSNEDATRLLSHSLNQLKHALEAQGVTIDRIQVQQAPKSDSSNSPNDGQKQQQDQQSQNWQDDHAARQEQQRKELLKRMWQKLSGGNPVDVTA